MGTKKLSSDWLSCRLRLELGTRFRSVVIDECIVILTNSCCEEKSANRFLKCSTNELTSFHPLRRWVEGDRDRILVDDASDPGRHLRSAPWFWKQFLVLDNKIHSSFWMTSWFERHQFLRSKLSVGADGTSRAHYLAVSNSHSATTFERRPSGTTTTWMCIPYS